MNISQTTKDVALIIIVSCLLFIPFIGSIHLFDWDEINFAEAAREMIVTNDYSHVQINFETFWEKPPLFFWMQSLSMFLFGVNEFAARFPNAIAGVFTLLTFYFIGKKLVSRSFAFWWMLLYTGSLLPHFYFRTGIIDPFFNLFIFISIFFLYQSTLNVSGIKNPLLAGLFTGLAILIKGPVGMLIILLSIGCYSLLNKKLFLVSFKQWIYYFIVAGLTSLIWFAYELFTNGPFFIQEFIIYQIRLFKTQDAGHGGPFYYHFVVVLLGCFPLSFFSFFGMKKNMSEDSTVDLYRKLSIVSLLVVLILFSIVKTKIVHYSSFSYFPLSFLAALAIKRFLSNEAHISNVLKNIIFIYGIIIGLVLLLFPILMHNLPNYMDTILPYIKDDFAKLNLQNPIVWSGYEGLVGLVIVAGIVASYIHFKKNLSYYLIFLFSSIIIFHETVLPIFLPKIEPMVQGEFVEFLKSKQKEDCYVEVYNFKSFAHLYYTDKPSTRETPAMDTLLYGRVTKPVYLITKVGREQELEQNKNFSRIGGKYGFCFYKRNQ
jgi:4-amino-4-deoxy-L-arabinose transferase-like glycosyltransferase